jgi:membrane protein
MVSERLNDSYVYNEEEKRNLFKLNALSLAFTLSAIVFMLLALGAMAAVPIALRYVGLADITETLIKLARWPALFILVSLADSHARLLSLAQTEG